MAILKNIRFFRLIHNLALLGLGFYLAGIFRKPLMVFDWLLLLMAFLAVFFYWLAAVSRDDIYDEEIDKISNSSRPLPQKKISKEEISVLGNVFLAFSYVCAFLVGYEFFLLVLIRSMVLLVYSCPPFRLKRVPLVATGLLALAAVVTVLAGFLAGGGALPSFPRSFIWFMMIAFALGFTVKDIKDREGDKENGVLTIPVLFEEKTGKLIIGFLAVAVFLSTLAFFPVQINQLFLPSIIAAFLSFWLINRKNYSETPLFILYFFYGLFFIFTVIPFAGLR
jgi:4-hydroxybenzoate polyprenyltransferase